jgi:ferredoxin
VDTHHTRCRLNLAVLFPPIDHPSRACPMTNPTLPFFIAKVEPDGLQCDAWPEQPLLLSLEQGGIDWPSSCRNGTCRTCIGQLVEGTVRYAVEWPGLSAEEKAEGCVLPCVAYPASDVTLQGASI